MLSSMGLATGTGLLVTGIAGPQQSHGTSGQSASVWRYVRLDGPAVAPEAARLYVDGGCMYGVFGSIVAALARAVGGPYCSFPVQMMCYGEGGVGGWGSLCGALNGGAAAIGLVVREKERREAIIGELMSWYEGNDLPVYRPAGSPEVPKSKSRSVLCHVSVGRWCKVSGSDVLAKERKDRCSRLTADVAVKTIELLNRNLEKSCKFAGPSPEVKACLSCHGKQDLRDVKGSMECGACHTFSKKHP